MMVFGCGSPLFAGWSHVVPEMVTGRGNRGIKIAAGVEAAHEAGVIHHRGGAGGVGAGAGAAAGDDGLGESGRRCGAALISSTA